MQGKKNEKTNLTDSFPQYFTDTRAADKVSGVVQKILAVLCQNQGVSLSVKEIAAQLLLKAADGAAQPLL